VENSDTFQFLKWIVVGAAAATLVAGCGKKEDPIAQAEKKDAAKGAPAPGIIETKAIAKRRTSTASR